ncbi:MAG: hypothetical protein WAN36_04485 [Calditrichia bacterium]
MTQQKNESVVLEKIQYLKEIFKFGGEIVPFVEELFIFINDVLPLMDKVSSSLQETNSSMPMAQDRITEASNAAEAATQQIMDKLESINQNLAGLSQNLNVNENSEAGKLISTLQNDAFEIVYALQFQDITAQQLAHAQQILEAIYQRFHGLFEAISALEIDDSFKSLFFGKLSAGLPQMDEQSISAASEDTIRNQGVSQDDIDRLFQNQ